MQGTLQGIRRSEAVVVGKAYPLFSVSRDCQILSTGLWASHLAGQRTLRWGIGRNTSLGDSLPHSLEVIRLVLFLSQSIC